MQFQSTPSIRRATDRLHRAGLELLISIHALHTEGDAFDRRREQRQQISIHALHTEGDGQQPVFAIGPAIISIHALHTEGDCILRA